MSRLPVIVGFGGINPAGRSSGHHAYKRLVVDKLASKQADATFQALGSLMQIAPDRRLTDDGKQYMRDHTLIRKIETNLFDPDHILVQKTAQLGTASTEPICFTIKRNQLPDVVPPIGK